MSKRKEIATTQQPQLPAFMQEDGQLGVEEMQQFITPPRLKIVQRQSGQEFLDKFEPGEVILVPQFVKVAGLSEERNVGEPFYFTPIFFFPEWCLWNPIETKGSLPAIRERTLDPDSPMVVKSRRKELWEEKIDGVNCRYCEHLNFLVLIHGNDNVPPLPVVMSYARAEHRTGSNLASLIKMRNAPLFGCNFQGVTRVRSNQKGTWFGIDPTNPDANSGVTPFISSEAAYKDFRDLHMEYKEAHQKRIIRVDYEDDSVDTGEAVGTTEF